MILYLAAQALVYAAIFAIAHAQRPEWTAPGGLGDWPAALVIIVLPLLGAWTACEVLRATRPVRLLDPRVRAPITRALAGLLAGGAAFTLMLLTIEFAGSRWAEAAATTGAAFLATAAVALCSSRQRPGACTQCRYDLSTITTAARGRCPECGSALHAA